MSRYKLLDLQRRLQDARSCWQDGLINDQEFEYKCAEAAMKWAKDEMNKLIASWQKMPKRLMEDDEVGE